MLYRSHLGQRWLRINGVWLCGVGGKEAADGVGLKNGPAWCDQQWELSIRVHLSRRAVRRDVNQVVQLWAVSSCMHNMIKSIELNTERAGWEFDVSCRQDI